MGCKAVSLLMFSILLVLIENNNSLETNFLEVPINHFVISDKPTNFKLRYLTDNQFYTEEGPIFVYLGHEEDVDIFARNTDFLYNIAPIFKALIVFVEHRYYGKSLPFGNETFNSTENMGYLSTRQALGDFALVINHLQSQYFKEEQDSYPIIAFGGGYGGNLAAWLRMKYPNLVKGAVASSAPLMYSIEESKCGKFYEKVTEVFEEFGNKKCMRAIKLTWEAVTNLTNSSLGREFLSSTLNLCKPIQSEEDSDKLIEWLSNIYVDLASFNYHYPSNYFNALPSYPVKVFCDKFTTSYFNDTKGLMEHYAKSLQIYTNYTRQKVCNNFNSFEDNLAKYAWKYQTCNELVTPKCSTDSDMFINRPWNAEKFKLDCFKNFGVINGSIDKPLINYGGANLKYYSNIVFSNGMSDPWSVYGLLANVSSDIYVYNIDNAPHEIDLRGMDYADNNYVINTRDCQINAIRKWLSE